MNYKDITSVEEIEQMINEDNRNLDGKVANPDKYKVIYADYDKANICEFSHIVVFTNDKSNNNKTLKNIRDAIKKVKDHDIKLHVFNTDTVDVKDRSKNTLNISDGEEEFFIDHEDNTDVLVFSRLSVNGEDDCEAVVKTIQDRGFLVLNPIQPTKIACNKYETAVLLSKAGIPQPNYCYMDKHCLYDEDLYLEAMRDVYPSWSLKNDKNADKKVVVKILDGHGGTGVFTTDGDKLYAILQTIFAIRPNIGLLIQKKEEADGGDIRVHVLTLRDKQIILAAMKRVKLSGDFRSNVSLGATAQPVTLTPEQEQIALRTATISGLPWCAVDIMPLVKGSNKELGDNVVLEINASPGTAGISEVIGKNFINVLLNELDDPNKYILQNKEAGYVESATIEFIKDISKKYLSKLDTGNSTTACTLEVGDFEIEGEYIMFKVDGKEVKLKHEGDMVARAGEEEYKRPYTYIRKLTLGPRSTTNVKVAFVKSREKKSTNLLLNRNILSTLGYVVDSTSSHILTDEMEKVKIL